MFYQRKVWDVQAWQYKKEMSLNDIPSFLSPFVSLTAEKGAIYNKPHNSVVFYTSQSSKNSELYVIFSTGYVCRVYQNDYVVLGKNNLLSVKSRQTFEDDYQPKEQQ